MSLCFTYGAWGRISSLIAHEEAGVDALLDDDARETRLVVLPRLESSLQLRNFVLLNCSQLAIPDTITEEEYVLRKALSNVEICSQSIPETGHQGVTHLLTWNLEADSVVKQREVGSQRGTEACHRLATLDS